MNWTSDKIDQIAPALLKAQIAMKGAKKDKVNPHLKNAYADLASVFEACKKPLNDAGIAIIQPMVMEANMGKNAMTTVLLHESGQFVSCGAFLPDIDQKGINAAQAMGSAISYIRRYQLSAMAGVLQEDDDGNAVGSAEKKDIDWHDKFFGLKMEAEKNCAHTLNLRNWYKKHEAEINELPDQLRKDLKAHVKVLSDQLEKPEEAQAAADPTLAADYEPEWDKGE